MSWLDDLKAERERREQEKKNEIRRALMAFYKHDAMVRRSLSEVGQYLWGGNLFRKPYQVVRHKPINSTSCGWRLRNEVSGAIHGSKDPQISVDLRFDRPQTYFVIRLSDNRGRAIMDSVLTANTSSEELQKALREALSRLPQD